MLGGDLCSASAARLFNCVWMALHASLKLLHSVATRLISSTSKSSTCVRAGCEVQIMIHMIRSSPTDAKKGELHERGNPAPCAADHLGVVSLCLLDVVCVTLQQFFALPLCRIYAGRKALRLQPYCIRSLSGHHIPPSKYRAQRAGCGPLQGLVELSTARAHHL